MRVLVTLERVAVPSFRPCFVFSFFSLVLFFFRLPLFLLCIIVLFKLFQVEGRRKRATGTPESSASSDDEIVLFSKDIPGQYIAENRFFAPFSCLTPFCICNSFSFLLFVV